MARARPNHWYIQTRATTPAQWTYHTLFGSNTRMWLIGSPQHTNVRSGNRLHPLRYHSSRMWKLQKFLLYHLQCLWRSATRWCELRPLRKPNWLVTMECSQQWIVSYQSTLMLQLALFRCGPMFFFRSYSFQTIWWRLIPWRIEMVPYWKWTCHRPTLLESYQHKLIYERKTKNCHHSSLNWKSFTYMHCSLINGE